MSHAQEQIPDYILLAHLNDDTHAVVCHYHGTLGPDFTVEEIDKMAIYFYHSYSIKPIRFQLARVEFDLTVDLSELH